MQNEAEINVVGNEIIQMEQVRTGDVGQQHTDGDGEQEQGLELLDDGQIDQRGYDHIHDQELPGGGVEGPARVGQVEGAMIQSRGGKQNLPDTRARQKVKQALNKCRHG